MEMPGKCVKCGQERMVLDAIHGVLACDACGSVGNQAETELRSEFQLGHVIERRGTYVGENDSGLVAAKGLMRGQISSHSFFTGNLKWSERHRLETMKKVETITALLRVPSDKVDQAKQLLESTLDGDWGMGRWVDILVAACVYIVIRQSQLPLTVPEVADCVHCDVVELGRMYNRVLQQLEITLPNVDAFVFLERAASTLPAFRNLSKDLVRKMKKQGTVLLDYAQECFIATGRRPLPVVAAVLSLVVEANKVVVGLGDVARELHAGIWATKRRYKECQAALVGIGQSLPWGKDITLKTVLRHLPFLLQYLELKVKLEKRKRQTSPRGERSTDPLAITLDNQQPSAPPQASINLSSSDRTHSGKNDTQTTPSEQQRLSSKQSVEHLLSAPSAREDQQCQIALDASSAPLLYQQPLKRLKMTELSSSSPEKACGKSKGDTCIEIDFSSEGNGHEPVDGVSGITQLESESQHTRCQSGMQMASEQILEPPKWEGLPASFCASVEARTRRQVKIYLAKKRIAEARKKLRNRTEKVTVDSPAVQSVHEETKPPGERRQEIIPSLDEEDLLIEHLVLCGASEAEIGSGYYQSLLALNPEPQNFDDDPALYLRSRSEVELLLEITGGEKGAIIAQCPTPLAMLAPTAMTPPPP